ALFFFAADHAVAQTTTDAAGPPLDAPAGAVPGNVSGSTSDTEFWRQIRQGETGDVSIPDKKAGLLIQSEGDNWRAFRNGPLSNYGIWALFGMVALLALFFALRGRIRIDGGWAHVTIKRFNALERLAHWVMAISFIVLALTGLNLLYGRYALEPLLGKEIFASITLAGKYAHNFIAFAFMASLALVFLLWVFHNLPNRHDVVWLLKGGGLLTRGSHPPSKKFNAGQKIIFWVTILGGLSLSLSGWALLDPFQYHMFGKTFAFLNNFGLDLPTDLQPIQEQQLAQLWHSIVALVMTAIILAHIYIGTLGIEGAFSAMGSGKVDLNWAKQHHNLWVEEVEDGQAAPSADTKSTEAKSAAPAE
ncbi:MAG TPA: formate dehydrogenase subunit gamma, partial [Kiloniellaceae bacterium]|nr:formate dehydrogenase subunit gamma [Kiloniellaceae bacterium]